MSRLNVFKNATSSFLVLLFMTGCSSTPTTDTNLEAFKNANRGAIGIIQSDYKVYKLATQSELTPITEQLLYSTIEKVSVIKGYEKNIGENYSVDADLSISQINQICWMGNFLQEYKQYIPANIDKSDTYLWLDSKQLKWKEKLNKIYGNEKIQDDCRYIK